MFNQLVLFIPLLLSVIGIQCAAGKLGFLHRDETENYIFLHIARLGLANRLRTLADWNHVAVVTNRTLLVNWVATRDCQITFSEIFEESPSTMRIIPFEIHGSDEHVIQTVIDIASSVQFSSLPLSETFPKDYLKLPMAIFLSDIRVIITSYDGACALEIASCGQYYMMHSVFLSSLKPLPSLREAVLHVKRNHFTATKIIIGVHIRTHNPAYDWNVVQPFGDSKEAISFDESAPVDVFIRHMRSIQEYFSQTPRSGHSGKECIFLVASPDDSVKRRLQKEFPNSLALSGTEDRSSSDGMFFAALEWLLLAETSFILHSFGSTFATEAAIMKMRPIVGVWGDRLIHHSSLHLPLCGNVHFRHEPSEKVIPGTPYFEGTSDRRKVRRYQLP